MTAGDSSGVDLDDNTTSGSDSADNNRPRPQKRRRATYNDQVNENKYRIFQNRYLRLEEKWDSESEKERRRRRHDFVVFEYLENGDLASLIEKMTAARGASYQIPNRVLWSFWLCCKSQAITISQGTY